MLIVHNKMNLLTHMRVFGNQFVKVFGPMAWLTKMYNTSSESCVQGGVDRLVFVLALSY